MCGSWCACVDVAFMAARDDQDAARRGGIGTLLPGRFEDGSLERMVGLRDADA